MSTNMFDTISTGRGVFFHTVIFGVQISLCVPSEDGLEVYSATHYSDAVQAAVAAILGKPSN